MTDAQRLELIREIYNWCGKGSEPAVVRGYAERKLKLTRTDRWFKGRRKTNLNRTFPVAWDLCQIFAAVAGDYRIEFSPHYKGVQFIRRNKDLWKKVSQFVVLKAGQACLPHDEAELSKRWRLKYGKTGGK